MTEPVVGRDDAADFIASLGDVVGERLREFRTGLDMTIAEVAHAADLSKAMVSKIENARASASLATLARLARALGLPITAFFRGLDEEHDAIHVKSGHGLDVTQARHAGGVAHQHLGMMRGQDARMEPVLVSFTEPVGHFPLYQHPGTELLFMIYGALEYGYGNARYVLEPGDALQFNGEVSHGSTQLLQLPVQFLSVRSYGVVREPRPMERRSVA